MLSKSRTVLECSKRVRRRGDCEFRTGLRPVPLDETGHPLFHTLRPPFAGRKASLLLLFRTKATPGLLRNFAPRNDDPARSEAAGGRSQRWRNKGALQAFFQASPKLACFAPSFSKQIFGGFVEFQWVTSFPNALRCFPNFSPPAARFRPHFAVFHDAVQ